MKITGLDIKISQIGGYAHKGQVGAKANTMRRIRSTVRDMQELRDSHWLYRIERFLLRKQGG